MWATLLVSELEAGAVNLSKEDVSTVIKREQQ